MLTTLPKRCLVARTSNIPMYCKTFRNNFAAKQSEKTPSVDVDQHYEKPAEEKAKEASKQQTTHKTVAQMDEELRQKMAGHAGDGGEAGIEYEDGQPVSMRRSVKNNMFRYI